MASYCTTDDLAVFGVNANATTGIDSGDVQTAIDGASDLIDGYLRAKFTLPLVAWGKDLRRACAIIAAYDLMSGRGYNPGDPGDDQLRLRYEDVLRWLRDVASGLVSPDVTGSASGDVAGVPSFRARVVSSSQRGWFDKSGDGGPFSGGC